MAITVEDIKKAVELARNAPQIPLHIVETEEDARRISAEDPLGREWKAGEAYYLIDRNGFVK